MNVHGHRLALAQLDDAGEVLRGLPEALEAQLEGWGLEIGADWLARLTLLILLAAAAALAHLIARRVIVRGLQGLVRRTETDWDDPLVTHGFFGHLAHLLPTLIVYVGAPLLLHGAPTWVMVAQRGAMVYLVFVSAKMAGVLLTVGMHVYEREARNANRRSIRSYVQVARLLVWAFAVIVMVGLVIDRSPWALLGGLGAMTAILLLVFKDSILGLVASVQISGNDLVRVGDWIEMPDFGADGDVIEISLTTVKVHNWNKTITTIPTYALVSHSFKNWRGMTESDGRRIKRSIHLDVASIRHATEDDLKRWSDVALLGDYLAAKRDELRQHNEGLSADLSIPANGRRLTNVGTFRAYVVAFLRSHPQVNQDMTLLVRQLAATERGLPIELYFFSSEKRWAHYEAIQADIFDHLFAILPEFDLRAFQTPTGDDVRELMGSSSNPAKLETGERT